MKNVVGGDFCFFIIIKIKILCDKMDLQYKIEIFLGFYYEEGFYFRVLRKYVYNFFLVFFLQKLFNKIYLVKM